MGGHYLFDAAFRKVASGRGTGVALRMNLDHPKDDIKSRDASILACYITALVVSSAVKTRWADFWL
jgi:hypothetical protein